MNASVRDHRNHTSVHETDGSTTTLTRRGFLISTAMVGGGLSLWMLTKHANALGSDAAPSELDPWLSIGADDTVTLRLPLPESGNGASTLAAMSVVEELHCDWSKVRIESISLNREARAGNLDAAVKDLVSTFAGRSTNTPTMHRMQQLGASARERLKAAAAKRWSVAPSEVTAQGGILTHAATARRLRYGEVAADAASVSLPSEPAIKKASDWTFLGKQETRKLSDPVIVNGQSEYGIDVRLPGMVYGALMQAPVHGGKLKRYDFDAIRNLPGVIGVAVIDPSEPRKALNAPISSGESLPQSAIAVVAQHYWQARKALEALPVEWDAGPGGQWKTTEQINRAVIGELDREGEKIIKSEGDALAELARAESIVEATYLTPFCDQAPLEPLNGTALVTENRVEVWHSGSISTQSFVIAGEQAGVPLENTHLHQKLVGGNFGRRNFADDLRMVVAVAKQFPGRPVQVIWSREEMMRQGRYRWMTAGKLKAALGDDGLPSALMARVCRSGYGIAGLDNVAYTNGLIPNVRIETREYPLHVLWGSYRAPGYNSYAFFMESFIDECAASAKIDPFAYRVKLLEHCKDPGWKKCLEEVATRSGWGNPLPRGQGRGIAISNWGNWASKDPQAGTTAAVVAHVDVSQSGELRVLQLDIAFDCGSVINRDAVIAQMQGGVIFGLNMSLNEELNIQDGRIVEGNFDQYPMVRMADIPKIHVHFGGLTGHARFAEVGEPPVGPVGPAIANAIFQATGKRVRSMPFRKHDLAWS